MGTSPGRGGSKGPPAQPHRPLGTSDCVRPAKESSKSTRSYDFEYKHAGELSKHDALRTDGLRG